MDRRANRSVDAHPLSVHRLNYRTLLLAALLILSGAALRVGMLSLDVRLHPDEALYATFARRISLHGDFLLTDAPLDKPPLSLIVTAGSFSIFGPTEFASRLPNLFASIISLALIYAIARRIFVDQRIAHVALLMLALSPLDLAFAATAFLDPLLTMLLLFACFAVLCDKWRLAGIAFICAVATKQTALVFLPLIISLGMYHVITVHWHWQEVLVRLRRFAVPVIIGAGALILWSTARAATIDFWTLGAINNNPGRLIRANEIVPRFERWLDLLANVTGFAPLLLLAIVPLIRPYYRRSSAIAAIVIAFVATCLLGYWLVAFNTYDRYLHPFGPLIILLIAAGAVRIHRWLPWLAIACMVPFTFNAVYGSLNIGGDRGEHNGIVELAERLNELPAGTQVNQYWLDWELGFYLGNSPTVQLVFQPSPEALERAVCNGDGYIIIKASDSPAWITPLTRHNIRARLVMNGNLRLYWLDCTF